MAIKTMVGRLIMTEIFPKRMVWSKENGIKSILDRNIDLPMQTKKLVIIGILISMVGELEIHSI